MALAIELALIMKEVQLWYNMIDNFDLYNSFVQLLKWMRMNLKLCSCRLKGSALCPKMWLSTSTVEHLLMAADTYTCPGTYWTGMSSMSLSTIVLDPLVRPFLSPKCMVEILFYSGRSWTDDSFKSVRIPGLNNIFFNFCISYLNLILTLCYY